jgi:hypothetical protein
VPDLPDVVQVREAVVPAMQLIGLVRGDVVELLPGPDVVVPATPSDLRWLLLRVLLAAAAGRNRSESPELVTVEVRPTAIEITNPANHADLLAVCRQVRPERGGVARAARPLGWATQHVVTPGVSVTVDVRWSPVEVEVSEPEAWS